MRKPFFMPELSPLVTAAELARIAARDDYRYELVDGQVIRMSPVGWRHGVIVVRLLVQVETYVRTRGLGAAVTEVGFILRTNPDTVRGPDVAFVRQERVPRETLRTFWSGAPDVAMEVMSPDDTRREMDVKVAEYLSAGVSAVVVVDPDASTATLHRPAGLRDVFRNGDELDLSEVIPGFRCAVDDIFS
jgi:Uma2 family endonuclease